MPRIRQSVSNMAEDVDRTSHKIDELISETRDLVFAVRELVNAITENGLRFEAAVAGHEIPAAIVVKTEGSE